ncbi:MAG: hypothetical protein K2X87_30055, partial [Gemmataceae bacterium]|nr:hypothetical protein [Gemmataceae bacterium]
MRKAEAARDADRQARYARLVFDTAAGRANGERVAAELKALGVPADVFAVAVGRAVNRQGLIARMRAGQDAERELPEVRKRVEAVEAERDRLVREFEREKLEPLRGEEERLQEAASGGSEARRELIQTAPPELVDRAADLARQRERERNATLRWRESLENWERASGRGDQRAPAEIERAAAELAAAEARFADLARQAQAAEAALLEAAPEFPAGGTPAEAEARDRKS